MRCEQGEVIPPTRGRAHQHVTPLHERSQSTPLELVKGEREGALNLVLADGRAMGSNELLDLEGCRSAVRVRKRLCGAQCVAVNPLRLQHAACKETLVEGR